MEVRGLRAEEVGQWLDFVAGCFAEKGTPRTYFERHVRCDADFEPQLVRVAVEQDGSFASTCRIFKRRMVVAPPPQPEVAVGGIGEVCTRADRRGRGLAPLVLRDALEVMRAAGWALSLLHAGPPLQPFYAKLGWFSVPMAFLQAQLDVPRLASWVAGFRDAAEDVRRLPAHTPRWAVCEALRQAAARRRQWRGFFQRPAACWSQWVAEECQQLNCGLCWLSAGGEDAVRAYLAFSVSRTAGGTTVFVREFAAEAGDGQEGERFHRLLLAVLQQTQMGMEPLMLNVGSAMVNTEWLVRVAPQEAELTTVTDAGWMYQILCGAELPDPPSLTAALTAPPNQHIFLGLDAF